MSDITHLNELRRRVQEDPASLAFTDLAEECRRAGETEEAVAVCRAGLVHHPGNITARVTLGRALVELGRLDDAFAELTSVLDEVPGNLPAIRALAEIYQRRGLMSEALTHYRRALELTQQDVDLAQTVERIQSHGSPDTTMPAAENPARIEELFDFDSLLAQLGSEPTPAVERAFRPLTIDVPVAAPIQALELSDDADDSFAVMERQLREFEEARARDEQLAREVEAERRRLLVLQELEEWLSAILAGRHARPTV